MEGNFFCIMKVLFDQSLQFILKRTAWNCENKAAQFVYFPLSHSLQTLNVRILTMWSLDGNATLNYLWFFSFNSRLKYLEEFTGDFIARARCLLVQGSMTLASAQVLNFTCFNNAHHMESPNIFQLFEYVSVQNCIPTESHFRV